MDRFIISAFFLILLSLISACSKDLHTTYCRLLASQIVFSGATSEDRKADIQTSEKPLLQHTYNNSNCEGT